MSNIITVKDRVNSLISFTKALEYGDIIPHEKIENIIDVNYISQRQFYNSIIQKAKKILLPYGFCLESVRGQGYRLVKPDDFTQHALRSYKSAFNSMKKGFDTLENAPVEKMTPEGRMVHQRVYDRATLLNASMKGVSIELRTLGQRKHPFALENQN